ncbi:hypothetical protein F5Y16DRAFT_413100 [Xylariaceae sp. FL0255]|nr:hypothetical protein F5Y16DRAFT_413100 [Xylariaceae sp. FL0255]
MTAYTKTLLRDSSLVDDVINRRDECDDREIVMGYIKLGVAAFLVPELTGPHKVGTTWMELIDHSRLDPFATTPNHAVSQYRHFKLAPQFPKKFVTFWNDMVNQTGIVEDTVTLRSYEGAPLARPDLPLILLSPGFGSSRLFYSDYAEELASYGYNIVTIDHTYDAPIVEYPDGRTIISNLSAIIVAGGVIDPAIFDPLLWPRVADMIFVLNSLSNSSIRAQIPNLRDRWLRTESVGAIGGSFGGATAYQVMANDTRFVAGGNFDGELFGTSVSEDQDRPFLFLASLTHNYTLDPSWREAWPHLKGFKRIFGVANTEHPSFLDWVVLRQILGDTFPSYVSAEIGTINGTRMLAIERAFTGAFFDRFLKGQIGELLDRKGLDAWPDITWIKEPPASGLYPS